VLPCNCLFTREIVWLLTWHTVLWPGLMELRIIDDATAGKLFYYQDGIGSKAQVQIALLSKGLKLTAADFFVI